MMETRIYIADVGSLHNEEVFAEYYGKVAEKRKAKIKLMHFRKDRCQSLGAGLLLKRACHDFGIRYEDEAVTENQYGKPHFVKSGMEFNLSHSGERVMCIMSEYSVGCDVERIETPDLQIAKSFFSPAEAAQIFSHSDRKMQADCFYRIWTLKESFIKCIGRGLNMSLQDFTIRVDINPVELLQNTANGCYTLGEWDGGDEYKYAWCLQGIKGEFDVFPVLTVNF